MTGTPVTHDRLIRVKNQSQKKQSHLPAAPSSPLGYGASLQGQKRAYARLPEYGKNALKENARDPKRFLR
jgi:hypothetical protein